MQEVTKTYLKTISIQAAIASLGYNNTAKKLNTHSKSRIGREIKGYAPKGMLWNKKDISNWMEKSKNRLELTAFFDDNVVFFMNIGNPNSVKRTPLKNMQYITGSVESIFLVMTNMFTEALLRKSIDGEFGLADFRYVPLTSYQDIEKYLKDNYVIDPEDLQILVKDEPIKMDWGIQDGVPVHNLAMSKREARAMVDLHQNGLINGYTLWSDGKVVFFANKGNQDIQLPSEFIDIYHVRKDLSFEEVLEFNSIHGKFIYTTKNVVEYLNANYSNKI